MNLSRRGLLLGLVGAAVAPDVDTRSFVFDGPINVVNPCAEIPLAEGTFSLDSIRQAMRMMDDAPDLPRFVLVLPERFRMLEDQVRDVWEGDYVIQEEMPEYE